MMSVLLNQFEMHSLSWEDTDTIQDLRRTYAHRSSAPSSAPPPKSDKPEGKEKAQSVRGPIFCNQFQTGDCQSTNDHATK